MTERVYLSELEKIKIDSWNAAIEAAADKIHDEIGGDEEQNAYWLERKVRELKK